MSGLDDRIREGLERLSRPADGSEALEGVARRKRRYRVIRRAQAATLTVAVIAGSITGVWALAAVFGERGGDRFPVTGPTMTPSTSPSLEPIRASDLCGPVPDRTWCSYVYYLLDRAGYDAEQHTGSALVGSSRFEGPPITVWTTRFPPSDADPVEPPPTEGASCGKSYSELTVVSGTLVCTDGTRHVWRRDDALIWVEAGQRMGDRLIDAEKIEPLVRASLVARNAEVPPALRPPMGGAEITSTSGSQRGNVETFCWQQNDRVDLCADAVNEWPTAPLVVRQGERLRVQILADAPPDDAWIVTERDEAPRAAHRFDGPALSNAWEVDLPLGERRSRLCGEWDDHGTVCWRFLISVAE